VNVTTEKYRLSMTVHGSNTNENAMTPMSKYVMMMAAATMVVFLEFLNSCRRTELELERSSEAAHDQQPTQTFERSGREEWASARATDANVRAKWAGGVGERASNLLLLR
jgi:hypothetical protein